MRQAQRPKSPLFLMEVILVILFFAIASVVCVQLFVQAYLLSTESSDLTAAVREARNTAEIFKAVGGSTTETALLLDAVPPGPQDQTMILYYDRDWNRVKEDGWYRLELATEPEAAGVAAGRVEVSGPDGEIFSLTVKKYTG